MVSTAYSEHNTQYHTVPHSTTQHRNAVPRSTNTVPTKQYLLVRVPIHLAVESIDRRVRVQHTVPPSTNKRHSSTQYNDAQYHTVQ
eukprot:2477099-Rhodomonas_salina.1